MTSQKKYVVVLGCYRSGSSCLSGVLHNLGVDFGHCVAPGPGNPKGFYEHERARLALIRAFDQSQAQALVSEPVLRKIVSNWCTSLDSLAAPIVGLKHPLLCVMGHTMESAFALQKVAYIATERPIGEILESLEHCNWPWLRHTNTRRIVQNLLDAREDFLAKVPHLRVQFHELVNQTSHVLAELEEFLQFNAEGTKRRAACDFIQPELVHHKSP